MPLQHPPFRFPLSILSVVFITLMGCSEKVAKTIDLKYSAGQVYLDDTPYSGVAIGPKVGYAFLTKEYFKEGILEGERVERYQNGLIKSREFYVSGKREGAYHLWGHDGKLHRISNYVNGKKNGREIIYSPLGFPATVSNFENGRKEGPEYAYMPKLNDGFFLSSITEYSNNNRNGAQTFYFHNGGYAKEVYFKNDYRIEGKCAWDILGELKEDF